MSNPHRSTKTSTNQLPPLFAVLFCGSVHTCARQPWRLALLVLQFDVSQLPLPQPVERGTVYYIYRELNTKLEMIWKNRLSAALHLGDGTSEKEDQPTLSVVNLVCGGNREVLGFFHTNTS